MDNRPIQVGDLVQVVHWPCCLGVLGKIFKVSGLANEDYYDPHCGFCGAPSGKFRVALYGRAPHPIPWLKRIPPLEELEGEKTQEDLREPA